MTREYGQKFANIIPVFRNGCDFAYYNLRFRNAAL